MIGEPQIPTLELLGLGWESHPRRCRGGATGGSAAIPEGGLAQGCYQPKTPRESIADHLHHRIAEIRIG